MKISVITIVYNDKEHIVHTINSVISQTARESIEYIIIDGNSNDGTSELIKNYLDHIDIYVCENDDGIYNAMNKGLQHATGDFVIFMNSGDSFCSQYVIEQVLHFVGKAENSPSLVYGDYRNMSGNKFSNPIPSRKFDKIWYGPVASHQSTFYNLHFLRSKGLKYDESYKIAADYKLTLEVIHSAKSNVLQLPICVSNFDMSGVSNLNQDLGLSEANRARREVLGWGRFKVGILTVLLLCARFARHHGGVLYRKMRYS